MYKMACADNVVSGRIHVYNDLHDKRRVGLVGETRFEEIKIKKMKVSVSLGRDQLRHRARWN